MKIRMELNKDEVNVLSELNCAITGKPLEMVNETSMDLISTSSHVYSNGELLYTADFRPEYILDVLSKIKEFAAMINPVAKRVNEMFKEFNDKWIHKPKEYEGLVKAGYRYVIEYRNDNIVRVRDGELYAYVEYESIPKILHVKDIVFDNNITEQVIDHLIDDHNM